MCANELDWQREGKWGRETGNSHFTKSLLAGAAILLYSSNVPPKKTKKTLNHFVLLKQGDSARGQRGRALKVQIVTVLCLLERKSIPMCYLPVTCIHTHTHTHSISSYFVEESSLLYDCVSPVRILLCVPPQHPLI